MHMDFQATEEEELTFEAVSKLARRTGAERGDRNIENAPLAHFEGSSTRPYLH